jgi:RNA polymerase sigma-32 factor
VHWIRAEIHEYVLRNWRLVKVATTKAQRKLFFNLRRLKPNLAWLSADETRAVAEDLGVSPAEVTEMERRLSARDLSFDVGPENDDEESFGPAAYLPAADADPAEQVEAAMNRLDDRSRTILQRRWMSDDKATLHELAAEYGVSAERIRQIEAGAMTRLKALLPAPA